MKKFRKSIYLSAALFIVLVSCNKDDEIIGSSPDFTPDTPEQNEGLADITVFEYLPAPGQYINDPISGFSGQDTMEEACQYALDRLKEGKYVSLGSWGGYIVVGYNHNIPNSGGGYDFAIGSNCFDTSNEPGIVYVMQDTNGNGLPDDEWFQLKGSAYYDETTLHSYWVTYFRPQADSDTPWIDSEGNSGSVVWVGNYHDQPFYYPLWIKEDEYTLYGTRLEPNAERNPVTGIWETKPYAWGYADNFGEDVKDESVAYGSMRKNKFRISDAVNSKGEPVFIEYINFVKVQTGVNSNIGILGENSTEVMGFFDENHIL